MKAKLVSCKACGREIARSARICPQCGQTRTTRASIILLLVIGLVLTGITTVLVKAFYATMQADTDTLIESHGLNPKDFK